MPNLDTDSSGTIVCCPPVRVKKIDIVSSETAMKSRDRIMSSHGRLPPPPA